MAQPAQLEVIGAREFRRTLKASEYGLADLKAVHKDVAVIAANASADLAPERSGRLKATIRASGTFTASIIRAGTARVPYAPPIHWGWGRRHITAQPFLSEGAQDSEGRWIRVYEDYVTKQIDQIKGT